MLISKENANNYDDYYHKYNKNKFLQTVDKALLLQGFAIVGTAFLI